MKIGDKVIYRGYEIERILKSEYVTSIAHDTLNDAKGFIDILLEKDLIVDVEKDDPEE